MKTKCEKCGGRGSLKKRIKCGHCKGTGKIKIGMGDSHPTFKIRCEYCGGEGSFRQRCNNCEGTGWYKLKEEKKTRSKRTSWYRK